MSLPLEHSATRPCVASRERILAHLSEPAGMARWCLGMWDTRQLETGVVCGRSLFSDVATYARIDVDAPRGLVRYSVGSSPENLKPWISAEVIDGAPLGLLPGTQVVSLRALRPKSLDDTQWQRIMRTHETEIDLIVAQVEADLAAGR